MYNHDIYKLSLYKTSNCMAINIYLYNMSLIYRILNYKQQYTFYWNSNYIEIAQDARDIKYDGNKEIP